MKMVVEWHGVQNSWYVVVDKIGFKALRIAWETPQI